jgi:RimJ/RimL family protein N-acetyltransferase
MHRPLEGELVRLRAREESDLEVFYRWINDWETVKYLGARYPRTKKFETEWLASGDPSFTNSSFIIETRADRRAIGWTGLHDMTPENRAATLGIAIGEHEFLDGGYGTDAMRTVCRFGFEMMNLNRIDLTVFDWNTRAIRVYEKIGFQHEGVLRHGMFKAGRWNDLVLMGLLRGELR